MSKRKTTSEFILESNIIHNNKYSYHTTKYINNSIKVCIICPKHGEFFQRPYDHLKGCGCKSCRKDKLSSSQRKSIHNFITECSLVHNNKYDYIKVNYINASTKVIIICPEHGEFEQQPQHHKNGSGCPICNSSHGERNIRNWLILNNISFNTQKTFSDCKHKRLLPFDFYLSNLNICIEFDGIQHFIAKEYFGGDAGLVERIKLDNIKTNYCKEKNIKLIRIRYNQSISNILSNLL